MSRHVQPARANRTRRAFTLFEVIVSLGLIMALLATMYAFLFDLVNARGRAMEIAARQRAVTMLMDRVEADLVTTLVGGGSLGAGVSGNETRLAVLTRSVAARLAERGINDPEVFGDLQRVTYRFDERQRQMEVARTPVNESGRPGRDAFESMGGEIHHVRFRFHDGTDWLDSYNSQSAGRLPVAIEIAIWFVPWPDDEPLEEEEDDEFGFDDEFEDPFERTFEDTFDEEAFALSSETEIPRPDRVRVFLIPDAQPDDSGLADDDAFEEDAS